MNSPLNFQSELPDSVENKLVESCRSVGVPDSHLYMSVKKSLCALYNLELRTDAHQEQINFCCCVPTSDRQ